MSYSAVVIIAIDQGSSATKVLCVSTGRVVATGRSSVRSRSAGAITRSVLDAISQAVGALPGTPRDCRVAISTQRSTLCSFDNDGTPVGSVVPWWDRSGLAREDVSAEAAKKFRRATGLPLIPNWFAGKLANHLPAHHGVGTVDTLLISWFTRGETYATDFSHACRTGLVDLRRKRRTRELLRLFGLPDDLRLASIESSDADFGAITLPEFPIRGRIAAALGDAGASLAGATAGQRGVMHMTLGTGGFLQLPVAATTRPPDGLYLAPAWKRGCSIRWTLEASIPAMASALDAGLRAVGLSSDAPRRIIPRASTRLRAILSPSGMGALGPEEMSGLRFLGPWSSADPEEKLGALCESLAFLLARAVRRFPERARAITAGGGLARVPFLLQSIANLAGCPVIPLAEPETSAWGAAMIASRGTLDHVRWFKPIRPQMTEREAKKILFAYHRLLA